MKTCSYTYGRCSATEEFCIFSHTSDTVTFNKFPQKNKCEVCTKSFNIPMVW